MIFIKFITFYYISLLLSREHRNQYNLIKENIERLIATVKSLVQETRYYLSLIKIQQMYANYRDNS